MKQTILLLSLFIGINVSKSQGLEGIIVEKYYQTDAGDSTNAADNGSSTVLHKGSVTYRVFVDMAANYKFVQMFGNSDVSGNVLHSWVIKTSTDFFNDPNNGQIFPQSNSLNNTKKHLTLIDSYLATGGVCAGKVGVLKTEDTDGSIGNSNGVLLNNAGGLFGAPINSVNANAQDGLATGTFVTPNALGLGAQTAIFDQTAGSTFSVVNGAVAALGGVVGTTTTNAVLLGQFTTNGIFSFSLNVQIQNTLTSQAEVYVHSAPNATETLFQGLTYTSATTNTTNVGLTNLNLSPVTMFEAIPNPTNYKTTLRFTIKNAEPVYVSVFGQNGSEVLTMVHPAVQGDNAIDLDLSAFSAGVYFVTLNSSGTYICKKIVKR